MLFSRSKVPKKREHKVLRRKKVRKPLSTLQLQVIVGIVLAIMIALIVTAIWYVTRIESLQIKEVDVIGGETIPQSTISGMVDDELSGTYLHLIPKRFAPLYPKQAIAERIRKLDRIKNVDVEEKDQKVTVAFEEYIPYALWCEKADAPACLFIDQDGYAFAEAPELEGSAFIRFVHEGIAPAKDTSGFDPQFMRDTRRFVDLLHDQLSLYVTIVTKIDPYDITYTVAGGGDLKVSQSMPIDRTFSNLKTVLTSEEFSHLAPGSFRYIDLRFGDKIFLNDHVGTGTTSTSTATSTGV